MSIERRLIIREFRLLIARPADLFKPMWFLTLVVSVMPLALSPDSKILADIGSAVIWVGVLLALLLNSDQLFYDDFDTGVLEQYLFVDRPLSWIVGMKLISHWILQVVPLIIVTPLIALMLSVDGLVIHMLVLSLFVATPALTCFTGLGAALTLGTRRSGVLGVLVMMPLFVPVIILASGILIRAKDGTEVLPLFALLGAFSIASAISVPVAIAAALRLNIGGSN